MCVYIRVCTYLCVYICVYISVCTYVCVHLCVHICVYICMCGCWWLFSGMWGVLEEAALWLAAASSLLNGGMTGIYVRLTWLCVKIQNISICMQSIIRPSVHPSNHPWIQLSIHRPSFRPFFVLPSFRGHMRHKNDELNKIEINRKCLNHWCS